jgi:hypothetical protein
MILIVGETLVDLSLGEYRQARGDHTLDAFAVLQEADYIVNGDARTLDAGAAASHVW